MSIPHHFFSPISAIDSLFLLIIRYDALTENKAKSAMNKNELNDEKDVKKLYEAFHWASNIF